MERKELEQNEEGFPEDPKERFEVILSAIGNSEAKCLTLLCLSKSPITGYDLHQRFIAQSAGVWRTDKAIQANYCHNSLIPAGLAQADIIYYGTIEYVTGFSLTEAGERVGQPIASFLLEQSAKLPYSLLEIFGPTSNRANIIELLYRKGTKQRVIDITNELKISPRVVGRNLQKLDSLGFVTYTSINSEQPGFAPYILTEAAQRENVKTVATSRTLTQQVADLLFEQERVDVHFLTTSLKLKYPHRSFGALKTDISIVLSGLANQKICQAERFIGRHILSQAEITKKGEMVISSLILPIKTALLGDEVLISSWENIAWQRYVKEVILKYKQTSGQANKKTLDECLQEVFSLISQNPGVRPVEILRYLGREYKVPLGRLVGQDMIKKVKTGRSTRYYPISIT
ncbi:hypothetical protein HYT18_02330 [Candidatus Microgenomates bacterium]|nr:hypothetical protein [Candidatus Microgenomates bacterium]